MVARLVDLHAHTVVSDGTLLPAELVRLAHARGLAAVAVTDHDHVGGIAEAQREGDALGVRVVPGIELSVRDALGGESGIELHLLGLFIDPENRALLERLTGLQADRARRVERMVARLAELGAPIPLEDVARQAAADGSSLGRPHVARVLMQRGHVATIQEAFDRFLADGKPAAVPKARLLAREGIDLVHGAGGVAVLAHPFTVPEARREGAIRALARLGLDGVEVEYSKHSPELRSWLRSLASELGLVESGGSDFHGENKPEVELGSGIQSNVRVPWETLEALLARRPSPGR